MRTHLVIRDWETNAAALRGCLYGLVVAVLLWFAWPEAPEPEPGFVAVARHDVARLRALRDTAHARTEATKPAVVRTREQVLVIAPGVLELHETPTSAPVRIEVPILVTDALVAERAHGDAADAEIAVRDSLEAAQDTLSAAQDRQLGEERRASRWRHLGALAKGAAIGAATVVLLVVIH